MATIPSLGWRSNYREDHLWHGGHYPEVCFWEKGSEGEVERGICRGEEGFEARFLVTGGVARKF